jgi:hypothetical protein
VYHEQDLLSLLQSVFFQWDKTSNISKATSIFFNKIVRYNINNSMNGQGHHFPPITKKLNQLKPYTKVTLKNWNSLQIKYQATNHNCFPEPFFPLCIKHHHHHSPAVVLQWGRLKPDDNIILWRSRRDFDRWSCRKGSSVAACKRKLMFENREDWRHVK